MDKQKQIKAAFYGMAIGDALGVPVEFKSRSELAANPVRDYRSGGTWRQVAGTFSDDSSLAFCLAESLCEGYNPEDIGKRFVRWYQEGYWGAHDEVFDIGGATRNAIRRLQQGTPATVAGGMEEWDNGNGSLMRILPLVFNLQGIKEVQERYQRVKEVSSITHAHFRSVFSCFIYCELALLLLEGKGVQEAYAQLVQQVQAFVQDREFNPGEIRLFDRVLQGSLGQLDEKALSSEGYVLDTLESSLWCLLTSGSYEEAVLKAVNLGGDTDTTAAVTGGLAGIVWGMEGIPESWLEGIAKREAIGQLAERMAQVRG